MININAFRFFPQNKRFTYLSSVSLFKDKYPFIPRKPKLFVKKDNYIIRIIATTGTFGFCGVVRIFFLEGERDTDTEYLFAPQVNGQCPGPIHYTLSVIKVTET